ncbi:MAG: hypothetical protein HYW49_00525 [Deltaproteobacteria bacterium]|nr:hypothetical protein [Deltaproteobacteria bacterium]
MSSETEKALLELPDLFAKNWPAALRPALPILKKKKFRSIMFVGTGSSNHVAHWAQWLATHNTGMVSQSQATWDLLAADQRPDPDCLVVVISHRGNRGLTEIVLSKMKSHPHVLIAAEGAPRTKKGGFIAGAKAEKSKAHTRSLFGAMCAISELLCHFMPATKAARLREERHRFGAALKAYRDDAVRAGHWVPKTHREGGSLYFVGGGPFHPVARELALKAREMARIPSGAFGLEEILHGPIVSLRKADEVVLLPSMSPPADDLGRYLYLARMAELVQKLEKTKVTVTVPRFSRAILLEISKLEPCWQALLYLYWGQWGMLGAAYQSGFDPDRNPYL